MTHLTRSDEPEARAKCNICGYDLTYLEFMFLDGKCVFHAEGGLTSIKGMSAIAYIWLLLRDLWVVRGKLRMKSRGLTAIDFQACVSEVVPELHEINSDGLRALIGHMEKHGRHPETT